MPHVTYGWFGEEIDKPLFWNTSQSGNHSSGEKWQMKEMVQENSSQHNIFQLSAVEILNSSNNFSEKFLDRKKTWNKATNNISKDSYLKTFNLISTVELKRQSKASPSTIERYHPTKFQYSSYCPREGNVRSSVFDVDITSEFGQLLTYNFQICNITSSDNSLINKYEKYCSTFEPSSQKFFLRDRTITSFPITYSILKNPKKRSCHEYCFNRKQKEERKKTILTGLNKRARRLKRECKTCFVKLKRLKLSELPKTDLQCTVSLARPFIKFYPEYDCKLENSCQFKNLNGAFQFSNGISETVKKGKETENIKQDLKLQQSHVNRIMYPHKIGKEIKIDDTIVIDLCSDDESEDDEFLPSSHLNSCDVDKLRLEKENLNILKCQKTEFQNHSRCPKVNSVLPYTINNVQKTPNSSFIHSDQRTLKENEKYLFNIRNQSNNTLKISQTTKFQKIASSSNRNKNNKRKCYVALENVENLLNASEKGTFYVKGTQIFISNPSLLQKQSGFNVKEKYLKVNGQLHEWEPTKSSSGHGNEVYHFNKASGNFSSHEKLLASYGCIRNCVSDNRFISPPSSTDKLISVADLRNTQDDVDGECSIVYISPTLLQNRTRTHELETSSASKSMENRTEDVHMDVAERNSIRLIKKHSDITSSLSTLSNKRCTLYKRDLSPESNSNNIRLKNKRQFSESVSRNRLITDLMTVNLPKEYKNPIQRVKKNPFTLFKCVTCNYVTTLHDNSSNIINRHIILKHGGLDNVTVMKQTAKGTDFVLYKTFVNNALPLSTKL